MLFNKALDTDTSSLSLNKLSLVLDSTKLEMNHFFLNIRMRRWDARGKLSFLCGLTEIKVDSSGSPQEAGHFEPTYVPSELALYHLA
jgi:hypothetical protein